jgi:hypothetical protein
MLSAIAGDAPIPAECVLSKVDSAFRSRISSWGSVTYSAHASLLNFLACRLLCTRPLQGSLKYLHGGWLNQIEPILAKAVATPFDLGYIAGTKVREPIQDQRLITS